MLLLCAVAFPADTHPGPGVRGGPDGTVELRVGAESERRALTGELVGRGPGWEDAPTRPGEQAAAEGGGNRASLRNGWLQVEGATPCRLRARPGLWVAVSARYAAVAELHGAMLVDLVACRPVAAVAAPTWAEPVAIALATDEEGGERLLALGDGPTVRAWSAPDLAFEGGFDERVHTWPTQEGVVTWRRGSLLPEAEPTADRGGLAGLLGALPIRVFPDGGVARIGGEARTLAEATSLGIGHGFLWNGRGVIAWPQRPLVYEQGGRAWIERAPVAAALAAVAGRHGNPVLTPPVVETGAGPCALLVERGGLQAVCGAELVGQRIPGFSTRSGVSPTGDVVVVPRANSIAAIATATGEPPWACIGVPGVGRSVAPDGAGGAWVGTTRGLVHVDAAGRVTRTSLDAAVTRVATGASHVWVGTDADGLWTWDAAAGTSARVLAGHVRALVASGAEAWAWTDAGIHAVRE